MLHRKTIVTSDSVVVYCIIISAPPLSVCVWTIVMRCCFLTFHYSHFLDLCRRAIYTWCMCDWAAENPLPSNVVLKVHIRVDCRCGSERICEMPAKLTFIWMWLQRLSHPSNEYWILNRERFDRSSERSGSTTYRHKKHWLLRPSRVWSTNTHTTSEVWSQCLLGEIDYKNFVRFQCQTWSCFPAL